MSVVEEITERTKGKIYFVMEKPAGAGFIELEDADGRGVDFGKWVRLGQYYALEIDDPRGEYNTSTDLTDNEIELILAGLAVVATQATVEAVGKDAVSLIEKLGFDAPDLTELAAVLDRVAP